MPAVSGLQLQIEPGQAEGLSVTVAEQPKVLLLISGSRQHPSYLRSWMQLQQQCHYLMRHQFRGLSLRRHWRYFQRFLPQHFPLLRFLRLRAALFLPAVFLVRICHHRYCRHPVRKSVECPTLHREPPHPSCQQPCCYRCHQWWWKW